MMNKKMPSQKYMVPLGLLSCFARPFLELFESRQSGNEDSMQQTRKFSLWLRPEPSSVAHTELVAAVKAFSAKTSGELL